MNSATLQHLAAIVGKKQLTTNPEELACYSYDGSALEYPPAAVAFPAAAQEISRIMALATEQRFPVVVRGAGTGMTGGALPVKGGLVIATSRLNNILAIDPANQLAVVQPGVITGELKKAVAGHGLFYPPDPASYPFCTIGGNVAECAGGPTAVKYGVTRDYIRSLEVVLADGRIMTTGEQTAKGVAGYDLTRLFVGSEGTLGIITQITVRLVAQPQSRATFLVLSDDLGQATLLVNRILSRLLPCTLEYMDRTAIDLVADKIPLPVPQSARALLLIELDGQREIVQLQARQLTDFLAAEKLLAVRSAASDTEAARLWAARRAISPASFQLRPHKLSEDIVVPRSRIPDLVLHTEQLAQQLQLPIFTFGHAGDGNIHVNIMLDRNNADELARATSAKEEVFNKALALGGTISGEHGIGLTKAAFLPREVDPVRLAVMRQLKELFDPLHILNPGKIFL